MKKLIFAAAAIAAGVAMADVTSSNVVGYSTVDVSNQYTMIGLNWETVGAAEMAINDLFGKDQLVAGANVNAADQIQVWNGTEFEVYFFKAKKTSGAGKFTYENSWVKSSAATVPTTDTIPAGTGFWFKRYGDTNRTLVLNGGVKGVTNEKAITSTYTMMGSAFPCDVILNGTDTNPSLFDWKNCSCAGANVNAADQIQVWNGTEFEVYFFKAKKTSGAGKFTYENSWVKSSAATVPTTDTIPAGKGFWYKRYGETTTKLVENSPIAK